MAKKVTGLASLRRGSAIWPFVNLAGNRTVNAQIVLGTGQSPSHGTCDDADDRAQQHVDDVVIATRDGPEGDPGGEYA